MCVLIAIVADTFMLATTVGRVFQEDYAYAWFSAFIGAVLLLTIVVPVTLLIGACSDMEEPFGDDAMDMPALSYAAAAAERTLAMVLGNDTGHGEPPLASAMAGIAEVDAAKLGLKRKSKHE